MTDEELMKLPNNDRFAQYFGNLYYYMYSKSERKFIKRREERENEIKKCNHLFLILKNKEYVGGFHSSDCGYEPSILECVHCGLTNKFEYLEETTDVDLYLYHIRDHNQMFHTIETNLLHKLYPDAWKRGGKSFDNSVFNLISDGVIATHHAGLLYKLALIINPQGTNEELFNIMSELSELETDLEKFKLNTIEQCADLLDRYKKRKVLSKAI